MGDALETRFRWVEVESPYQFNLAADGQGDALLMLFQGQPYTQVLIPRGLFGYRTEVLGADEHVFLFGNTYQKIVIFNGLGANPRGVIEILSNDWESPNFSKTSFQLTKRVNLNYIVEQLQLIGVPLVEELDWLNRVDPEPAEEEQAEAEGEEDVGAPPPPPPAEPPSDNPQQLAGLRMEKNHASIQMPGFSNVNTGATLDSIANKSPTTKPKKPVGKGRRKTHRMKSKRRKTLKRI